MSLRGLSVTSPIPARVSSPGTTTTTTTTATTTIAGGTKRFRLPIQWFAEAVDFQGILPRIARSQGLYALVVARKGTC